MKDTLERITIAFERSWGVPTKQIAYWHQLSIQRAERIAHKPFFTDVPKRVMQVAGQHGPHTKLSLAPADVLRRGRKARL